MDAVVLHETRDLLNALNDENAELRAANDALAERLALAGGAHEAELRGALQRERDLASRLQSLQAAADAAQAQRVAADNRAEQFERQCAAVQSRLDRATGEMTELRSRSERSSTMEAALATQREAAEAARSEAEHYSSELARVLAAQRTRETHEALERAHGDDAVRAALQVAETERDAARREVESIRTSATEEFARLIANLEAASAAARRVPQLEAEVQFVRDQLAAAAETAAAQLQGISTTYVQPIAAALKDADAARWEQRLRVVAEAAAQERAASDTAIDVLTAALRDAAASADRSGRELRTADAATRAAIAAAVDVAERDLRAAHAQQKAALEADLQAAQAESKRLRIALDDMTDRATDAERATGRLTAALREAESDRDKLRADYSALDKVAMTQRQQVAQLRRTVDETATRVALEVQTDLSAQFRAAREVDREAADAARHRYEAEIAELRADLGDHTETLTVALQRLNARAASRSSSRTTAGGRVDGRSRASAADRESSHSPLPRRHDGPAASGEGVSSVSRLRTEGSNGLQQQRQGTNTSRAPTVAASAEVDADSLQHAQLAKAKRPSGSTSPSPTVPSAATSIASVSSRPPLHTAPSHASSSRPSVSKVSAGGGNVKADMADLRRSPAIDMNETIETDDSDGYELDGICVVRAADRRPAAASQSLNLGQSPSTSKWRVDGGLGVSRSPDSRDRNSHHHVHLQDVSPASTEGGSAAERAPPRSASGDTGRDYQSHFRGGSSDAATAGGFSPLPWGEDQDEDKRSSIHRHDESEVARQSYSKKSAGLTRHLVSGEGAATRERLRGSSSRGDAPWWLRSPSADAVFA